MAQVFSAQRAIRDEVVTILDDMFVKCQNGAVEPGIVDRDVPALTVSPGTGLQQSLPEFDPSLLGFQQLQAKIRSTALRVQSGRPDCEQQWER